MKNFFKTSLYVAAFALAGVFFQVACSNDSSSSPAAINKILYTKHDGPAGYTLWYCDIDGANPVQIPLNLPAGVFYGNYNSNIYAKFSPDGQKVLFSAYGTFSGNDECRIYSCDLDGNNLQEVVAPSSDIVVLDDVQ